MTIEEKVQDILFTMFQKIVIDYNKNQDRFTGIISLPNKTINQATQTLLALIKPMSREKLVTLIVDYKCGYPFVHRNDGNHIGDENAEGIADAILAEWGGGRNEKS